MHKFYILAAKPFVYVPAIIIVLALGTGIYLKNGSTKSADSMATVTKGSITETVAISGRVRAAQNVDLSLAKTGRITTVNKKVGDKVFKGEIILTTDAAELYANLAKEQAKLEELTTSARPEEISIATQNKVSAQATVDADQAELLQKISSAYTAVDDAIHNKVDQFMTSPNSASAQINFPVTDQELARTLASQRYSLETDLTNFKKNLATIANGTTPAPIVFYKTMLDKVSGFLNNFSVAINSLTASTAFPQSTISVWKSDIASARSGVSTASQNLVDANQAFINAQGDLVVATEQLSIKQNGGSVTDIKFQQGAVDAVIAQINDTLIRAPFDGVVTRQDADIGQTVQASTNIVSMVSNGAYEVEANIPEINVSKVKIGNKATITLDAFGPNVTFDAEVISVDLSEQIIDGVPSYKTKLQFTQADDRIKTGMTANVLITTADKQDVLVVPQQAVSLSGGALHVSKISNGTTTDVVVTTGVTGDGLTEITSGLNEGDQIKI